MDFLIAIEQRFQVYRTLFFILVGSLSVIFMTACTSGGVDASQVSAGLNSSSGSPAPSQPDPNPTASPSPVAVSSPPPSTQPPLLGPSSIAVQPLWATRVSLIESQDWTAYAYDAVQTYGTSLLTGSSDMTSFCPKFSSLTTNQKISFWVYLVSAIASYESDFNPDDRYQESTMGTDPVTGQPVYSEGLLQLSYQDVQAYPYCNQFDWQTDKNLSPTDPKKTIFDPQKNLTCGIRILNWQVQTQNLIAYRGHGQYWATLIPDGAYTAVPDIEALTSALSFCK